MISYIRGTLAEKNEDSAVVEAHGVGYQIFVPVPVLSELPPLGESVKIYTYFSVREDGMGGNQYYELLLVCRMILFLRCISCG